jgi:uncharacterized protein (DUF1499 family)
MTRQSPWEKSPNDVDTDTEILPPTLSHGVEEAPRPHKKVEIKLPTEHGLGLTHHPRRPSKMAQFSCLTALSALTALFLGAAGAHYGLLSPFVGFRVFVAALLLGGLTAFVAGFLGMLRTAKSGPSSSSAYSGRTAARFGLLVGAALLASLAFLIFNQDSRAPIHDITTDPQDPPAFLHLAALPQNHHRDLSYPQGPEDTSELQRLHYPEVQPIPLRIAPGEALDSAIEAALACGWKVIKVHRQKGMVEAEDETGFFRFVDDVVIRVRTESDGGSRIDLRSTSRVGISDLGANAARIHAFEGCLRALLRN